MFESSDAKTRIQSKAYQGLMKLKAPSLDQKKFDTFSLFMEIRNLSMLDYIQ